MFVWYAIILVLILLVLYYAKKSSEEFRSRWHDCRRAVQSLGETASRMQSSTIATDSLVLVSDATQTLAKIRQTVTVDYDPTMFDICNWAVFSHDAERAHMESLTHRVIEREAQLMTILAGL